MVSLDVFVVASVLLLVLGVVGSVVPLLPGAAFSLLGVGLYWWSTGYTDPGPVVLVAFVLVGLLTMVVDYFSGAISARAGGASWLTTGLAAAVGIVLVFVAGPVGLLVGVAGTVFVVEYVRSSNAEDSARAAVYATVGMLASTVMQVLMTGTMLVGFLVVIAL